MSKKFCEGEVKRSQKMQMPDIFVLADISDILVL